MREIGLKRSHTTTIKRDDLGSHYNQWGWYKVNIDSKKYCQILQDGLLPVLDWFYPDYVFVHDNAPVHSCAETRKCVEDRQNTVSEWPPQPPNLNIIENVWQMMKVKLYEDYSSITTRAEFVQRLQLLWRNITTAKS